MLPSQKKAALQMDFRHFRFGVYHTYLAVHVISLLFFFAGLLNTTKPLISNLEKVNESLMNDRAAKGYFGPITFEEVMSSQNESHPLWGLLHEGRVWISHAFGSAPHNYCWLKHKKPAEAGLPSLLRLVDYNSNVQVLFRAAVLIGVGCRFFFSIVWGEFLLTRLRNGAKLKIISVCYTVSDLLWQTCGMLAFCLQQDQDKILHWLMYWHLPLFALFFVIHSMIYIIFSSVAFKRTLIHYLQLGSVLLFAFIFPQIYEGYLPFLEPLGKPCYATVPTQQALLECVLFACVFVVLATQYWEMGDIFGVVTVTNTEHQSYFSSTDDYSPLFATQIKQILCVPVQLSTLPTIS